MEHAALGVEHDVVSCALEHIGGALTSEVDERARRGVDRRAADLHRARSDGEAAALHLVGVAVHDLDVVDRHPRALGHHHRPSGVVSLTERRRTAAHADAPSVEQLDSAEFAARRACRDLDVHREPDAERDRIVRGPASRLLCAQRVVVRGGQDALERLGVVADVVDRAEAGRVPVHETGDEVAATNLSGVHADLRGEAIDHALDRDRCLGTPRAAVGGRRHGVRHHADAFERHVRDLVDARGHPHGHHREHGADERERPGIANDVEVVGGDPTVAGAAELGVLHLAATMRHRDHVLGAGLGPLHRATDRTRVEPDRELLGIRARLRAEPPTDVGHDDAHLRGVEAVDAGEQVLGRVRALARGVVNEAAVVGPVRSA